MALTADILRKIKYDNFVVIDLETTGLDPTENKIIEIGIVRYVNGKEEEKFEQLVNPEVPIPDFITKLTGIKDKDVEKSLIGSFSIGNITNIGKIIGSIAGNCND